MGGMEIDLNCDLGEGCGLDFELMPLITSANICCGFHAGDARTALTALSSAAKQKVRVGAHPGYPDREQFGRHETAMSEQEVYELCLFQIGALAGLARDASTRIAYVKPHGALYHQACRDDAYAQPIRKAAMLLELGVMGLPGSRLEAVCAGHCPFVREGFADRRYQPDGSLVPRSHHDAFIDDPHEAVQQAQWLIRERGVQTLCVHGDNLRAVLFVEALRAALLEAGFTLRAFS
jgi:5-oxoprolinase (ATP-hydrolysing) subunit A